MTASSEICASRKAGHLVLQRRNSHQGIRFSRTVLILIIAIIALSLAFPVAAFGQSQIDEYRLKAAFLLHFAQFVEWPASAFENNTIVFCVVSDDPFHGDLEGTVQGKSVSGKSVRVRHIRQLPDSKGCQLLFMGKDQRGRVHEFIANLSVLPVLTVGESDDFLQQGGIIRFCMEDRKVRFEVNQDAAEKAHLNVSARLLLLARTVIGHGGR